MVEQRFQPIAGFVQAFRPFDLKLHEVAKAFVAHSTAQVIGRIVKPIELLLRQVNAVLRGVFFQVAQNIRELKGHAALPGKLVGRRIVGPPDADAGQADGRSHEVAIMLQLLKRAVCGRLQIHRDAVDHGVKILAWHAERGDRVGQGRKQQIVVLAGDGSIQRAAPKRPARDGRAGLLRRYRPGRRCAARMRTARTSPTACASAAIETNNRSSTPSGEQSLGNAHSCP